MALGFDFSSGGRLDDRAREELRGMAEQIVRSYLGEPNRSLSNGRVLRWGRKGSFTLNVSGDKQGLWHDFENGVGGDVILFIAEQRRCSIKDAIDYTLNYVLSTSWSAGSAATAARSPASKEKDDADRRTANALRLWAEVLPLRETLAEAYLAKRGIVAPDSALDALGFHFHCPFSEGRRAPALIALITDIVTAEPIAIHRRELTPDATAAASPRSLGPKSDGAIRLAQPENGHLVIAEGIETGLAGMILGFGPVWSVIDAEGIKKFPVLEHIDHLTILVDHDVNGTGQNAAAQCAARWRGAGKRVRSVMPKTPGHDFNDVLLARLAGSPDHA
jgi:putative DNA primase/helicase